MCGITGIYRYDNDRESDEFYRGMVNSLHHRGPDAGAFWVSGPYFLGHRRLSIIDITTGDQPMGLPGENLVVTFNGEIYNYKELKKELAQKGYIFATTSDTEVLLHGYHAWGIDLPSRLIGMFAFVIADRRDQSLFMARDRFGEKPLFLLETSRYVAFASEIKTLTLLKDFTPELDLQSFYSYLCLNYVPGNNTLMKGIHSLQPGSWALYNRNGKKQERQFFNLPAIQTQSLDQSKSLKTAKTRLLKLIDDSVRITLRSDVPVGIFLSGGIDSSIIAQRAVRFGNLNKAFCLTFSEQSFSEVDKARFVAKQIGVKLETIQLTPKNIEHFFSLVHHADDPLADSSCLPVYVLSKFAASTNKVVLGGDGGDELFGGYLTYKATLLHQQLISRMPQKIRQRFQVMSSMLPTNEQKVSFSYKLARFLRAWNLPSLNAHFTWNGTWLPDTASGFINPELFLDQVREDPFETLTKGLPSQAFTLRDLQAVDIQHYLVKDILTKVDRMSMAHGLEIRAPFLHPNIAEFGLNLPARFKLSPRGHLKFILRQISADLFGKRFSKSGKQGFSIPIHAWLRREGAGIMTDLLSEKTLKQIPELQTAPVLEAVSAHLKREASLGFELWGLMTFVQWYKTRIYRGLNHIKSDTVRKLNL